MSGFGGARSRSTRHNNRPSSNQHHQARGRADPPPMPPQDQYYEGVAGQRLDSDDDDEEGSGFFEFNTKLPRDMKTNMSRADYDRSALYSPPPPPVHQEQRRHDQGTPREQLPSDADEDGSGFFEFNVKLPRDMKENMVRADYDRSALYEPEPENDGFELNDETFADDGLQEWDENQHEAIAHEFGHRVQLGDNSSSKTKDHNAARVGQERRGSGFDPFAAESSYGGTSMNAMFANMSGSPGNYDKDYENQLLALMLADGGSSPGKDHSMTGGANASGLDFDPAITGYALGGPPAAAPPPGFGSSVPSSSKSSPQKSRFLSNFATNQQNNNVDANLDQFLGDILVAQSGSSDFPRLQQETTLPPKQRSPSPKVGVIPPFNTTSGMPKVLTLEELEQQMTGQISEPVAPPPQLPTPPPTSVATVRPMPPHTVPAPVAPPPSLLPQSTSQLDHHQQLPPTLPTRALTLDEIEAMMMGDAPASAAATVPLPPAPQAPIESHPARPLHPHVRPPAAAGDASKPINHVPISDLLTQHSSTVASKLSMLRAETDRQAERSSNKENVPEVPTGPISARSEGLPGHGPLVSGGNPLIHPPMGIPPLAGNPQFALGRRVPIFPFNQLPGQPMGAAHGQLNPALLQQIQQHAKMAAAQQFGHQAQHQQQAAAMAMFQAQAHYAQAQLAAAAAAAAMRTGGRLPPGVPPQGFPPGAAGSRPGLLPHVRHPILDPLGLHPSPVANKYIAAGGGSDAHNRNAADHPLLQSKHHLPGGPRQHPLMPNIQQQQMRDPRLGPNHPSQYLAYQSQLPPERPVRDREDYTGLMTQKERDFLIKIQKLQLEFNDPYVDDYYFVMYMSKKAKQQAAASRKHLTSVSSNTASIPGGPDGVEEPQQQDDASDEPMNEDSALIIPRPAEGSEDQQNGHVGANQSAAYQPRQFEGALGKIAGTSISRPRLLIELKVEVSDLKNSSISSEQEVDNSDAMSISGESISLRSIASRHTMSSYRQLLLKIESLYALVLQIDDEGKRALAIPPDSRGPIQAKRAAMLDQLVNGLLTPKTGAAALGTIFSGSSSKKYGIAPLMGFNGDLVQVRKGLTLVLRTLPLLYGQPAQLVGLMAVLLESKLFNTAVDKYGASVRATHQIDPTRVLLQCVDVVRKSVAKKQCSTDNQDSALELMEEGSTSPVDKPLALYIKLISGALHDPKSFVKYTFIQELCHSILKHSLAHIKDATQEQKQVWIKVLTKIRSQCESSLTIKPLRHQNCSEADAAKLEALKKEILVLSDQHAKLL